MAIRRWHPWLAGALLALLARPAFSRSQAPAADPLFSWLRSYVGHPTHNLAQDSLFSTFIELVVPNLGIRMGSTGQTLPQDLTAEYRVSGDRVTLASGRYLAFSGHRPDGGASRSFIWVDLQQGRALGAVFVQFLNEPPVHRLILFSRRETLFSETDQLPQPFLDSLAAWQKDAHLPALLPLYFAQSPSNQHVLLHSIHACPPAGAAAAERNRCPSLNRSEAEVDLDAALLTARELASRFGPLGLRAVDDQQEAWLAALPTTCPGPPAGAPDCRTQASHARALALAQYTPPPRTLPPPGIRIPAAAPPALPPQPPSDDGFRDADAGVEFIVPSGWTSAPAADGVRLASPDQQVSISVSTEYDTAYEQAVADLPALACRGAAVPCAATVPPHVDQLHGLAIETASGTLGENLNWRADLIAGRLPVLVRYQGPPDAMISDADAIAAFRAGLKLLP